VSPSPCHFTIKTEQIRPLALVQNSVKNFTAEAPRRAQAIIFVTQQVDFHKAGCWQLYIDTTGKTIVYLCLLKNVFLCGEMLLTFPPSAMCQQRSFSQNSFFCQQKKQNG
jgi:hypothetical protein